MITKERFSGLEQNLEEARAQFKVLWLQASKLSTRLNLNQAARQRGIGGKGPAQDRGGSHGPPRTLPLLRLGGARVQAPYESRGDHHRV